MNFSYDEIRSICGTIGLVIFVGTFLTGAIWTLLPKNKENMDNFANIPFEDNEDK